MLFKNLPAIQRGVVSKASYSYDGQDGQISQQILRDIERAHQVFGLPAQNPFARVGGGLAIHCEVSLAERKILDAASVATPFRGYESLLLKRGLREAGLVSSTASGICGGVHATASALCLEMALGIKPPPLGTVARNLLLSCQYLNDNPMHLFVLSGPDYSEETIRRTNPEIWTRAERAPARFAAVHGSATVGELMTELNRPGGRLFAEALEMIQLAREAYALLGGKYPHSESIIPGGVALAALSPEKIVEFQQKLLPFHAYVPRCIRIWDEIFDFLYEANPAYRRLGESPATMVDFGQWDHEDHYDATFANCDRWGENRWSTPGALVDGELRTTRLTQLNAGLEDFVDRSYHEFKGQHETPIDPLGNPLSPFHPWNKRSVTNPAKATEPKPYSWASALTWDRNTFEVGAYARVYLSAIARKLPPSQYVESTGRSLLLHIPSPDGRSRETLEWKVPPVWNAFERNRARAYAIGFNLAVTLENCQRAKARLAGGDSCLSTPFEIPNEGTQYGAGFCGAGRGFLAHWAVIANGVLANYQIAVPSRINAGPRAPWGVLGACERAVLNSPIIETNFRDASDFEGIDIVRAIQSFDPCMPCTAHFSIHGTNQLVKREVTTDEP